MTADWYTQVYCSTAEISMERQQGSMLTEVLPPPYSNYRRSMETGIFRCSAEFPLSQGRSLLQPGMRPVSTTLQPWPVLTGPAPSSSSLLRMAPGSIQTCMYSAYATPMAATLRAGSLSMPPGTFMSRRRAVEIWRTAAAADVESCGKLRRKLKLHWVSTLQLPMCY